MKIRIELREEISMEETHVIEDHVRDGHSHGHDPRNDTIINILFFSFPLSLIMLLVVSGSNLLLAKSHDRTGLDHILFCSGPDVHDSDRSPRNCFFSVAII